MFVCWYENPLYQLPVVTDVLQKGTVRVVLQPLPPNEARIKDGVALRNQFRLTLVAHLRYLTLMNERKGSFI